jgi:hypothetical protein
MVEKTFESETEKKQEVSEFFQLFLSLNKDSNLYESWESQFFFFDESQHYEKRRYIQEFPSFLTFRILRVGYDQVSKKAVKLHDEFRFEDQIYADRFSFENEAHFRNFRQ